MKRGKNTNNTLEDLRWVLSLMNSNSYNYDGRNADNAKQEVKEDIKELEK